MLLPNMEGLAGLDHAMMAYHDDNTRGGSEANRQADVRAQIAGLAGAVRSWPQPP